VLCRTGPLCAWHAAAAVLESTQIVRQPRWPAFVAMLAAAGVYLALPAPLSLGPSWLLLVVIVLLLIPIVVSDRRGHHNVTRILTFTANIIITVAVIASLIHLVTGIPQHLETPKALLRSASALWIANILVFALWYWKLDAGGPLRRERPLGLMDSSFFFIADGYSSSVALGKTRHDGPIVGFAHDYCPACRARTFSELHPRWIM